MSIATIEARTLTETDVRQTVDRYLANVLGPAYSSSTATRHAGSWSFLIRYQDAALPQPSIVGRLQVNEQGSSPFNGATEAIIPLTDQQIQEICETAAWEVARRKGELARNRDGYISRQQARRVARYWLDQHLSMKFGANDGRLLPLNPPAWQFSIYFSLRDVHWEPLGSIEVNAQTGAVIPLDPEQLHNLREHVRAAIQLCPQTAAV
jgi:hypothetical protein